MSFTTYFYPHSAENFATILKSDPATTCDRIVKWSKRKVSAKQLKIGLPLVADFSKDDTRWRVDHFHVLNWIAASHLETVVFSEFQAIKNFSYFQQIGFLEPMSEGAPYPLPSVRDAPLFAGFFPCSKRTEIRFDDPLLRNRAAIEEIVSKAGKSMGVLNKLADPNGEELSFGHLFATEQELEYPRSLIADLINDLAKEQLDLLVVICD